MNREVFPCKIGIVGLLLGFLSGMVSCTKEPAGVDAFSEVEKVTEYEVVYSEQEDPLGMVTHMDIVDNILILEHVMDTYRYSFVDVDRKEMLCRWGTVGEGPNEFIDFGTHFFLQDSLLVFSSLSKRELNYVFIPELLHTTSSPEVKRESYPYVATFRPRKICPVNDIKIVMGSFDTGLGGVLGKDNEIIGTFSDFPFSCEAVQGVLRGSVFQSQIAANPSMGRFVVSILSSDIFEIYEIREGAVHRVYQSSFEHIPQVKEKGGRFTVDGEKSMAGLMNVGVSSRLLCFLYSSQSYVEASRKDKFSDEVLCFDWDGQKVKKYILPFPVCRICLDDNFLYGIRFVDDKMTVCRFRL